MWAIVVNVKVWRCEMFAIINWFNAEGEKIIK
jgi:hypothetical protein